MDAAARAILGSCFFLERVDMHLRFLGCGAIFLCAIANCSDDDGNGSVSAATSGSGASSASASTAAAGGGGTCPTNNPLVGRPCTPDALYCEYAGSPCPSAYLCESGAWTDVSLEECTFPCGDTQCFTNELCVQMAGGPGYTYSCEINPCTMQPFDCSCAGSLCGGDPYICTSVRDRTVMCECPQCA